MENIFHFYFLDNVRTTSFNQILANIPILYPVKIPESQRFSGVSRGIKWKHLPEVC